MAEDRALHERSSARAELQKKAEEEIHEIGCHTLTQFFFEFLNDKIEELQDMAELLRSEAKATLLEEYKKRGEEGESAALATYRLITNDDSNVD